MIKEKVKKSPLRALAGASIAISVIAIAGQSVLATLNATTFNTQAQSVDSGTLKLNLTNAGDGFSQAISNLAPGDVVNRYVTLTNTGTLDGIGLKLKADSSGTQTLISDSVGGSTNKAIKVTVTNCSQAWSGGICGGTSTTEISATALSALSTATPFANSSMNSGDVKYLQIKLQLPDQNELTTNGNAPANSVQGGNITVTYNFDLAQRLPSTSNS
jgi:hypothetical protein